MEKRELQALYASETLTILTKSDMENILKEERKIIRKILGPKRTVEGYRLHSRKTTQQMSNIAADIRKRRLKFYGHISRLPPTRIANRILKYIKGSNLQHHGTHKKKLIYKRHE
ncbi:hypothetical protein WA026_016501 [Henosepilachna vigintioctopunctata]|uniref:Ribosomal protein S13 n=1 Tax=Henosepilachna vigintioctopunctata TaxID=420089 RepID=A0AAW1VDT2_9CUCU